MLTVENLFCERDERVLFSQLSFEIKSGDILQIEGENGSGKTSLLRILARLSNRYEGQLYWQHQPIDNVLEQYFESMLYVGHLPAIKTSLTAEENLRWMQQLSPHLNQIDIQNALTKVGLYGFEDVPCYQLSAGQQRRVGLARLYLSSAILWILDEPFTALDKKGVSEKEKLIAEHVNQGGMVILTTHHHLQIPNRNVTKIILGA
jgi:heme exporter protein A